MAGNSKFTDEIGAVICELVKHGLPIKYALAKAGISKATLSNWRKRARDGEEPYLSFSVSLDGAVADMVHTYVSKLAVHADADWKAAAWMLERRVPEFRKPSEKPTVVAGDTTQIAMPANGRMRDGS